jgi:hypothetical protein
MEEEARRKRAEQVRSWLAEMERLGADVVRFRIASRQPVTEIFPYPDAPIAEEWLPGKKRAAAVGAAWLYAFSLLVSIVAAVAACIAAWPVLKEWFGK